MYARAPFFLGMFILLALACNAAPSGAEAMNEAASQHSHSSFTYYSVQPDVRRCVSPLCGGVFVTRVNKTSTRCANGSRRRACYVATVDYDALGLSDRELAELHNAIGAGQVLLRGQIEPQDYSDFGNLGRFVVSEAWLAASDHTATRTYYRVAANGIRCITYPCLAYDEAKLNSRIQRSIADVDLQSTGATDQQIKAAYQAMTNPDGVLVAGTHTTVRGPAGKAQTLIGSQFYTRLVPNPCQRAGCSGEICADSLVFTTCEWRPEYACYQTTTCEQQADGQCGWTETPELLACLTSAVSNP